MNPFVAKNIIFPIIELVRNEPIRRHLQELEQSQWLETANIESIQLEKLKRIIKYAYENIPFYQCVCKKSNVSWKDISTLNDWKKLPFLTKEDLSNKAQQLIAQNYKGKYSKKTTGGSTGQAVTINKDRNATAYLRAAMWRGYRWSGINVGDKQARFWGVPLTYLSRKKCQIIDLLSNRIRLSAFNFSNEEMFIYYKRLTRFKPHYFYGYVSAIMAFAEFLNQKGLDPNKIGVNNIITTAEVLHDYQRSYIQETFQCNVRNEYGCGEVGPIVMECPQGGMHINSDNFYVEFLEDEENKHPNIKEIVITELNSYLMPLIRYRIKDYAITTSEKCTCGRGLPLIKGITGRSYDWVVSGDNKYFHGEYFMYLLEEMKRKGMGVKQFQIIQESKNDMKIRIVQDVGFSEKTINYLNKHFRKDLGTKIRLNFEYLEYIPREKSGKIRLIISNVS